MSVEATKVDETTPVVKSEQPTETPAPTETPTVAETTETPAAAATTTPATDDAAVPATEEPKKGETVVEATPASEGVLGYKAPGFLKQFHYSKNHFWFSDEPVESVSNIREKHGNEHAAWARETGKGALFFSKRAEDKSTPSGMILLHEASELVKDGFNSFSFKVGTHFHKFEAVNSKERDSWIVAFEKKLEEAKALKDEIVESESYKKTLGEFTKPTVAPAAVSRSKSKEPKKSLEAATAAVAAAPTPAPAAAPETKTEETATPVPVDEKKKTEKERSQSRKRTSIFGTLTGKKDEQKTEKKKEEKAEKEIVKEEKKIEAEEKKAEAKETHEPTKVAEAAEASAVAAAPAAVVAATESKDDDKKEEKKEDKTGTASTPTDKKAKRSSVFGGLFAKKNVTSPSTEKTEAEAGPAKDSEVPPVSETAPKIEEPIENKPIDTAEVTAPATTTTEPTTAEPAKESTATEAEPTPKVEKKSTFFGGLKNKLEGKKEEPKTEDKTVDKPAETTDATVPATDGTAETATETPATKEERPVTEKRRTSLFSGLGTQKKKSADKKEETSEPKEQVNGTETKREKSPIPSKLGGLFRKPSKAVKSTAPEKSEIPNDATPATTENKDTPIAEEATPATATAPEAPESKIVGDVVPEAIIASSPDKVATAPEVKASA